MVYKCKPFAVTCKLEGIVEKCQLETIFQCINNVNSQHHEMSLQDLYRPVHINAVKNIS